MQSLYERYVRIGYYERRHPVRYWFVAAIAMFALLWPITWRMDTTHDGSSINPLLSAAELSFAVGLVQVLFSRSRRRRERFARWAAKHPEPGTVDQSVARSTAADRPALPRGRDLLAWLGWTLLVAVAVYTCTGLLLGTAIGVDGSSGAITGVVAGSVAIPAAIYLRLYWPPARDWKSRT